MPAGTTTLQPHNQTCSVLVVVRDHICDELKHVPISLIENRNLPLWSYVFAVTEVGQLHGVHGWAGNGWVGWDGPGRGGAPGIEMGWAGNQDRDGKGMGWHMDVRRLHPSFCCSNSSGKLFL